MLLLILACNQPPTAPLVAIDPSDPTTIDDLTVVIQGEASDPNGDPVSYSYGWFVNDAARSDLSGPQVPASETTKGETWKVVVTPADKSGSGEFGQASVTIANSRPEASASSLYPLSPTVQDDVTASVTTSDADEDPVTVSWGWTRNGVSAGLTEAVLPAGTAKRGEEWVVTATPNDGEEDGDPVEVGFTVQNSVPTLASVTLSPHGAMLSDTIAATASGFDDPDGDSISVEMSWSVDGATVFTETVAEGETSSISRLFSKGAEVIVTATPNDGYDNGLSVSSDALIIADTPPAAMGAHIEPNPLYADSEVRCLGGGWNDADGDAEAYQTSWTVNGLAAGTGDVLTAGNYHRGDTVACTLIPDDGELQGAAVSAAAVTVLNSVPVCSSAAVIIGETGLTMEDTATVLVDGFLGCTDADGDTINKFYDWQVDGVSVSTDTTLPVATYASRGQTITLFVTTSDGLEAGPSAVSNALTVANALPLVTSLNLSPTTLFTDSLVSAVISATDPDGDAVTLSYAWTVDGVASGSTPTLDGALFSKGQTVSLTVTPSDGFSSGTPLSASLVVSNSTPGAPSVTVLPTAPEDADTLVCSVIAPAADVDSDALSYTFTWTVGGIAYTSALTTTFPGDTIPASATSLGQNWVCSVTANDGTVSGIAGSDSAVVGCDQDDDGFVDTACGGDDCDDGNRNINPDAYELCDAYDVDEDCDGLADDADPSLSATSYHPDADGDGYGDAHSSAPACSLPVGWKTSGDDCDDSLSNVHPGASEYCDAADLDEDCDGLADNADTYVSGRYYLYPDADGDGYGDENGTVTRDCDLLAGYVASSHSDCNDGDAAISPAATEICADGIDNDCDEFSYPCGIFGTFDTVNYGPTDIPYTSISSSTYDIGNRMTVGDFNGDAIADLAYQRNTSTTQQDNLAIFFGPLATDTDYLDTDADVLLHIPLSGIVYAGSLKNVGDMDGDGDDELVVTASHNAGDGYIQAGSPTLTSGDLVTTATITGSSSFMAGGAAGDFNGDGLADAWLQTSLGSTTKASTTTIYLGNVSGTWSTVVYSNTDYRLYAADHGDFDGDGLDDMAVDIYPSSGDFAAVILHGDAAPVGTTFTKTDAWFSIKSMAGVYGLGDVTGDGYEDIGATTTTSLYVFEGPASKGLTTSSAYASINGASCVTADTDNDGVQELFVGPNFSNYYYAARYPTPLVAGTFGTSEALINTGPRDSMAVGDLTSDGYDDFLFASTDLNEDIYLLTGGEW